MDKGAKMAKNVTQRIADDVTLRVLSHNDSLRVLENHITLRIADDITLRIADDITLRVFSHNDSLRILENHNPLRVLSHVVTQRFVPTVLCF